MMSTILIIRGTSIATETITPSSCWAYPDSPGALHPLADPKRFYPNARDGKSPAQSAPYRRDSFILVSAGQDGLYGTADDICNFEWKYRKN